MNMSYNETTLDNNKLYYFGDVNPLCGGVLFRKCENDYIEAWYIGEFSPICHCHYICDIEFNNDEMTTLEQVESAYYDYQYRMIDYSDFKFMKAIDKDCTNISDMDLIDCFVRYDFNVWNFIKRYIGVSQNTKIIGV